MFDWYAQTWHQTNENVGTYVLTLYRLHKTSNTNVFELCENEKKSWSSCECHRDQN